MEKINLLIKKYIQYLNIRHYTPRSIDEYIQRLSFLLNYLNQYKNILRITEVTKEDIADYQAYLFYRKDKDGKGYSLATQNSYLSALRTFFGFLTKKNYILYNPTLELELPKRPQCLPKNTLTESEINRLLSLPDTKTLLGYRDRTILEVFYATAIRISELTNLSIYDIDLDKQELKVRQGKGQKDRVVPLGRIAIHYLGKYLKEIRPQLVKATPTNALFLTNKGRAFNRITLNVQIREYAKRLKIRKHITAHALRHTCATLMLRRGAQIRYIQELLGHKDIRSTQIYTKVTVRDLKKIYKKYHPREAKKALKLD